MIGLLAPVPEEHLRSGLDVVLDVGKVAFGSRAFEVFAKLDALRCGRAVDVLIYASDPITLIKPPYRTSWRAKYLGFREARAGAHPEGLKFRLKSTESYPAANAGHWVLFWEVADLEQIHESERIQIGTLTGFGRPGTYKKHFRPEWPILIDL